MALDSNVPGTPKEKYEALKAQAIKKGRYSPAIDGSLMKAAGYVPAEPKAPAKPKASAKSAAKPKVSRGRVTPKNKK